MLRDESTCIYENFDIQGFKSMREDMINLVLSTDMVKHFHDIEEMKKRLASMDF